MVRCIDLTLRSKEKSQSSSEQSRIVPWCTKPAALSRMSILPTRLAKALTSAVLRTSSRAVSAMPSLASVARPLLIDVGGDHGGAFARECDRAGAADARRGGGDEGAFALQAV